MNATTSMINDQAIKTKNNFNWKLGIQGTGMILNRTGNYSGMLDKHQLINFQFFIEQRNQRI